jgi:hypothetical protein
MFPSLPVGDAARHFVEHYEPVLAVLDVPVRDAFLPCSNRGAPTGVGLPNY